MDAPFADEITGFRVRVSAAERGEHIVYHTGLLHDDREAAPDAPALNVTALPDGPIDAVAREAMALHDAGLVRLVQKRVAGGKRGIGVFDYIAVKR